MIDISYVFSVHVSRSSCVVICFYLFRAFEVAGYGEFGDSSKYFCHAFPEQEDSYEIDIILCVCLRSSSVVKCTLAMIESVSSWFQSATGQALLHTGDVVQICDS